MVRVVRFGVVVLNDSVNSFDSVIKALQDVFNWDVTQAANCAYIVHNKGEYVVQWYDCEKTALYASGLLRLKGLTVKLLIDKTASIE